MNKQSVKSACLQQLKLVKSKKCPYHFKIRLIEGLIEKLRLMQSNPELMSLGPVQKKFLFNTPQPKRSLFVKKQNPSENHSTSYSFYSDNSQIFGSCSPQEYEQKIMEKRMIKFQINQEIEALEDDLFQIQKVVQTKRLFNDQLAKNITKRMKQIGQNKKSTKQDSPALLSKTSIKINKKDHYSQDMMNITVSGASGFGFINKEERKTSIKMSKKQTSLSHINVDSSQAQRKKAKSHYLSKGITGIFKNILK